MEKEWLEERRDLFLKNIVRDFFECQVFFHDLREHTERYGVIYDGFDFWVGTEEKKGRLWQLKDLCHVIWGEGVDKDDQDGVVFDWMVGAIFHEAMKLKENAYMFERYQKSFPDGALGIANGNGTEAVKEFFKEMVIEVERCIKRLEWLFKHAEKHLFQVLQREKQNPLLLRFLLADTSRLPEGEGRQGWKRLRRLLKALFPDGLDRAYCIAGESLLEGGWFQEARSAFERALKINPRCKDARLGLRLIEKRLKELSIYVNREFGPMNGTSGK